MSHARSRFSPSSLASRLSSSSPASLAAAAASILIAATVVCSAFREDAPIRFVRSAEDAGSGCSRVADVAAPAYAPESEVVTSIANEARRQKADTVVLAKGERKGTAYRCEAPQVAKKS